MNKKLQDADLRREGMRRYEEIILPQQLEKQRDHIKNSLIAELQKRNPYPTDIFTPLTEKEIKRYVKLLTDNGFSSDKIHAHWMRHTWDNSVNEVKKIFEEDEE